MSMKRLVFFAILLSLLHVSAGPLLPRPRDMRLTGGVLVVPPKTFDRSWYVYSVDPTLPQEGYALSISTNGVFVRSSDAAGEFYAVQTLRQLVDKRNGEMVFPCVEILDAPAYLWRGVHLDESRHFFGKETVRRLLDLMAEHKLNVFHWHLTDNQGWRVEIPKYPRLTEIGAVRPETPLHRARIWKEGDEYKTEWNTQQYGPFRYTRADIDEIVSYATERHIKVVPELELPGHSRAALIAYPEFSCRGDPVLKDDSTVDWRSSPNVVCIGNDAAVRFLEDVTDAFCDIFPSDIMHIGGDECERKHWKSCPKCQARIHAEGLKDEDGLQAWITGRIARRLAVRGRRALGWDECLSGNVPPSMIGMSWRTSASQGVGTEFTSAVEAVTRGHDMVMVPNDLCYYDYNPHIPGDSFQYIGGDLPLETAYTFDPCAGIPETLRKHVLGGQCCNWTEYTWSEYDLEWKMWPRTCAMAEILWTAPSNRDVTEFRERARVHVERLRAAGVHAAPIPSAVPFSVISYNVAHGVGMDARLDLARVGRVIAGLKADFVCLQELDRYVPRSGNIDEPAFLAASSGMVATFARAIPLAGGEYGVGILSRRAPERVERLPLPGKEARVLLLCDFGDKVIGTMHFSVDAEEERTASVAIVRAAVERYAKRKPVFLTGDWNSLPDSPVVRALGEFMTVFSPTDGQTYHGRPVCGPDKQPLDMKRFCIDYIAVDTAHSARFVPLAGRIVPDRIASDHAPVETVVVGL